MMKKTKLRKNLAAFCAALLSVMPMAGLSLESPQKAEAAGNLIAFPGAVGAGKYATGGRGGEIRQNCRF